MTAATVQTVAVAAIQGYTALNLLITPTGVAGMDPDTDHRVIQAVTGTEGILIPTLYHLSQLRSERLLTAIIITIRHGVHKITHLTLQFIFYLMLIILHQVTL